MDTLTWVCLLYVAVNPVVLTGPMQFTIKHYAGEVSYDVNEFCFKKYAVYVPI